MEMLWKAYQYAVETRRDVWEFAVEYWTLKQAGVSNADLRWMVAAGLAEHGHEQSVYGDRARQFAAGQSLVFSKSMCLVLTRSGVEHAEKCRLILTSSESCIRSAQVALDSDVSTPSKPVWDAPRRELRFGENTVKRFRVPARNQELILNVFEEEGWPDGIDDPIPRCSDIDPRTRLHDAINRLNGKQIQRLIRFYGNGSGTGVCWELRRTAKSS